MIQARRIDRRKPDRVLAKICSPWIWKNTKRFLFQIQTTRYCEEFPGSIILIFISEREKFGDQMWDVPLGLARRILVAGITFLLGNWLFIDEISNINNLSWMERINNYFILWMVVGDMGETASEMIRKLWSQKKRTSILSCCKFWWTEHGQYKPHNCQIFLP
jgi:hypothetical protein